MMKPNLIIFGACGMSLRICQNASQFMCCIISDTEQANKAIGEYSSFAIACKEHNIDLLIVDELENFDLPPSMKYGMNSLLLCIGAPWFFKNDFLNNKIHHPIYNLHGTRLPRERGGNIFSWIILNGQRTGICLIHYLTEHIDAGLIIDYEEFIYPPSCHKPMDYICYYEERNVAFVHRFIEQWLNGKTIVPIASQPDYLSTYWPRLRSDVHGWIDWNWSAQDIERFICAFDEPYGGARCRWRNKIVIVREAYSQAADGHTHPFQKGIVYRNNGKWLNIATNSGELIICSITDEQGNSLLKKVKPGDRLYSLPSDLEYAQNRILRTKEGLKIQPPLA